MSRDGSRRRTLSYEERVLWTTVTKAIKPLQGTSPAADDAEIESAEIRKPRPPSRPVKAARAATAAPYTSPQQMPPQPALAPLAPLGRRMKRSVARGKEAIDARLDLHGLTQSDAHSALLRFLRAASARGVRLALVITGKGGRGGDERGVLKRQVPQWLGLPEFRHYVVGFEDAHIAHGGEGALYLRVRRARNPD
jgi:DNA-nicking Smr family endonuclease